MKALRLISNGVLLKLMYKKLFTFYVIFMEANTCYINGWGTVQFGKCYQAE